jgi:hypothetical protein
MMTLRFPPSSNWSQLESETGSGLLGYFATFLETAMRRYTRLSNGFSRKIENQAAAIALNYFAYNFIKIHRTLRVTPAMAAGVTDHLWHAGDLVGLLEAEEIAERAAA